MNLLQRTFLTFLWWSDIMKIVKIETCYECPYYQCGVFSYDDNNKLNKLVNYHLKTDSNHLAA